MRNSASMLAHYALRITDMAPRSTQSNKPAYKPVAISRWRINAVLMTAIIAVVIVTVRLGDLQIVQSAKLTTMARSEIKQEITIPPRRGTIRDRAGNVLALDVDRESLYAVPRDINQQNAPRLALMLAGLLGRPAPELLAMLQDKNHSWVTLKRWLDPDIAKQVQKLADDERGLQLMYEPRRVYPQGSLAAHTIGAVNFEGIGISGVEGYYNTELVGVTGTITAEVDAQRNPIWIAPQERQPASNGADLQLTLDPLIQHLAETELKKAVDQHHADGGTVIVIEPQTGAIRGIASYPTFDPNRYNDYKPETYNINPAIAGLYEPGSTFKLVTVSAGLQFNEMTGKEKFYAMVNAYGYGKATGVDLAGEGDGIVKDPNAESWSPIDLDTNAFGQAISVTPLQQVRMVAAIGNDGNLMKPYIVDKICHADNCTITQPQQVGQPIDAQTAHTIREMIVKSGNGYVNAVKPDTLWLVPGYAVGAKTGTSQIPDGHGG